MKSLAKLFEVSHGKHAKILSMEGLRGFAVFLVFLVHFVNQIMPWLASDGFTMRLSEQMRSAGNAGVDLFFVLSGFLIYGTLIKRKTPFFPYMGKRVKRIYPTFLVVLAVYLLLPVFLPAYNQLPEGGGATTKYLIQNLLLLPGLFPIEPIIEVAWSLSYEIFYYLAVPVLIAIMRMRWWNPRARLAFFAAVTIIGFGAFYAEPGHHIRLMMFVSGILLYEVMQMKWFRLPRWSGLIALGFAMVVTGSLWSSSGTDWWRYVTLYGCFFMLCLECFRAEGPVPRLFTWTPMRWLGNMSYSYYLIHGLFLEAAFFSLRWAYPPDGASNFLMPLLLLPMFALTLVPSALLFAWVEKPLSLAKAKPAGTASKPAENGQLAPAPVKPAVKGQKADAA